MRISFTYALCLFFILSIQFSDAQKLSRQEMMTDIDYYFDILRNKHPNLYIKYNQFQYDSLENAIMNRITAPLSYKDFNRMLLTLNQYTDGHTQILTNQIWEEQYSQHYFPYISIHHDSLLVDDKILLTINNVNANVIINEIRSSLSWENNPLLNELTTNYRLPNYLLTFYNIDSPYHIQLQSKSTGEIETDTIEVKNAVFRKDPLKYHFKFFPEESIAVLFYNTCYLESEERHLSQVLSTAFNKIKQKRIKYLFIDIRLNGGGIGRFSEYFLNHINYRKNKCIYNMKVNINQVEDIIKNEIKHDPKQIMKDCGINIFKRFVVKRKLKLADKLLVDFKTTGILSMPIILPGQSKGFDGEVLVIQSRKTYSAAIGFTELIKQRKMGFIVGEKGGQPFDFCGDVKYDTLPNSKISIMYPTQYNYFTHSIPTEDGFLPPDIPYDVFDKDLTVDDYKEIIRLSNKLK
ncbi:S41 family peptidase [Parabacteroides goldsteinii]|nr:S41 family peptidase [Parabacteroides goldsteinii]